VSATYAPVGWATDEDADALATGRRTARGQPAVTAAVTLRDRRESGVEGEGEVELAADALGGLDGQVAAVGTGQPA
jgi:hypothetical protein